MIALGRNGESVVFFGSGEKGALVRLECSLDEAQAVLRQLRALLGEEAAPAPAPLLRPIANGRPTVILPAGADPIGDAVREAQERDAQELASRTGHGGATAAAILKRSSEEELAKQEARRQRLLAKSGGTVAGPVDE